MANYKTVANIKLPEPHEKQAIFTDWEDLYPGSQVLVAPAGTKVGKTMGASIWLLGDSLINPGFYNIWIAPTLYKCRIAYRYMKAMLPDIEWIDTKDGAMEIWMGNGSFIKFLHGRDAEVTVEGEAVDSFVIDEAGKQKAQLWHSLITTITQTEGHGIVTGTPRGRNWYYDLYQKAQRGDPMLCHATLRTVDSPFINPQAVFRAKNILPASLFRQYYLAEFVSDSQVYGEMDGVWNDLPVEHQGYWIHPDENQRMKPTCIGMDLAKRGDYTVISAVNCDGETVGYVRLRHKPYHEQIQILGRFSKAFKSDDNEIRYDRTGLGDVVGEQITILFDRLGGRWLVTPVVFTNAVKQEMVSKVGHVIDTRWWRCPRIVRVEEEFINLEVTATKTGMHSYGHPTGEHDDAHWSLAMAIAGALSYNKSEQDIDLIEAAMNGTLLTDDEPEPQDQDDDSDFGWDIAFEDDDVIENIEEME